MNKLIILILILGTIYKLLMTWHGNFLFNMDNARDMVDVREMVVLGKLRLIGPTSAIEGLYNGPAWYYLLTIPFIVSGGDPYASIMMEIILWAIGGFFLLKIISQWSKWLIIPIGFVWIASDYIGLTTQYAFNPNPVPLLSPLFIYLLYKYLQTNKLVLISSAFFLGGLFFNFEMNFGLFIPPIIFITTLITKRNLLKTQNFWLGSLFFLLCLLPQVLFEVRHNFFMTNAIINYLRNIDGSYNLILRSQSLFESFLGVFSATLMNHKTFTLLILIFLIPATVNAFKKKELLIVVSAVYILLPFLFYLFLPVSVNAWHLGAEAAALVILIGFLIKTLWDLSLKGKLIAMIVAIILIIYSLSNISNFLFRDRFRENSDPSLYKNELGAIDYVYQYANGQNFKVYTYLPSVYDYPYQYLFWWYGNKKYGFIPAEYVYSPNKPRYIPSQEKFQGKKENISGLVFLIKEPDRIKMRQAWENDFKDMEFISKEWVGPLEVEIRKE
ncbi:glycosyltransferase family 39 protein [Candidatus Daviesbacteria bacterium]|nr:glycosyltransferase family 39 protein [Candidatus Daviesbacteria bacterium]